MPRQPAKTGRPSIYTPELAETICRRITDGESLRQICASDGMPARANVQIWLLKHEEFAKLYDQATSIRFDMMAEEIIEIADTPEIGEKTEVDADGKVVKKTTGDMTHHRQLRVDARKWILSKLASKKFGDRTQLEHSGTVTTKVEKIRRVIVDPAAPEPEPDKDGT